MSCLSVKFQPSSTPPSDRFWWGVLVVLVVLVLLVTGVKQSQLLVLRLSLQFENNVQNTFTLIQLWRGPGLVPKTLGNQFFIKNTIFTLELSIRSTGVDDLCPVLIILGPFPGTSRVPGGWLCTVCI